jgi:uncharacterized membrane protein YidH (DUF202 family)
MTGFMLIAMGLFLIFIFSPSAGDGNQFKAIGIVICIMGALTIVNYAAWFYNIWRIYQNENEQSSEIIVAEAHPVYEGQMSHA